MKILSVFQHIRNIFKGLLIRCFIPVFSIYINIFKLHLKQNFQEFTKLAKLYDCLFINVFCFE